MKNQKLYLITCAILVASFFYPGISFSSEETDVRRCVMPLPEGPNGPWDYRTRKDRHELVESRHFTPKVENLIHGESTNSIVGDIGYTLGKFPNHPRALTSLIRYSERTKRTSFAHIPYSVECYLKRAVYFKEDDLLVRLIYASYLEKHGKRNDAISQLQYIESKEDISTVLKYNLGLLYFELRDYDKALFYAHQAYAEGFPLPGLKNKLISNKRWKYPSPKHQDTIQENKNNEINDSPRTSDD